MDGDIFVYRLRLVNDFLEEKAMRPVIIALLTFFVSISAWSDDDFERLLNTVTLQLSAEQWVKTQSALVTVGVNANVAGSALDKVQSSVLAKLLQVSNKGEWHIISFNRSLDQSGLERVQMSAQARLPSSDLGGLRDRAKAVSKPGETFTLDNVEFTPSEAEIREANAALRLQVYQQAKNEMANLAKLYPGQNYFIHTIDFVGSSVSVAENGRMVPQAMYVKVGSGSPITVGNKLSVMATVIVATAPSTDVTKIVHN